MAEMATKGDLAKEIMSEVGCKCSECGLKDLLEGIYK